MLTRRLFCAGALALAALIAGSIGAVALALLASACTLPPGGAREPGSVYQHERFQSDETFSRLFDANVQSEVPWRFRAEVDQIQVKAGEVATVLHAHRRSLRLADCEEAAFDLVALARALIDGAASRGRIEPTALEDKVMRAALGYLRRR